MKKFRLNFLKNRPVIFLVLCLIGNYSRVRITHQARIFGQFFFAKFRRKKCEIWLKFGLTHQAKKNPTLPRCTKFSAEFPVIFEMTVSSSSPGNYLHFPEKFVRWPSYTDPQIFLEIFINFL